MNICLLKMIVQLAMRFYQDFEQDPDLFADMALFKPYVYNEERCAAIVLRHQQLGREYLAIMLDSEPIGEIILKDIDWNDKYCN